MYSQTMCNCAAQAFCKTQPGLSLTVHESATLHAASLKLRIFKGCAFVVVYLELDWQ